MTTRMPVRVQRRDALRRVVALIGSATPSRPAGRPSTATNIDGLPLARAARPRARVSAPGSTPSVLQQRTVARARPARPSTLPLTPLPVTDSKVADRHRARGRARARPRRSPRASGCSLPLLEARREPKQLASSNRRRALDRHERGLPSVSVPVLSTTTVCHLLQDLERLGVSNSTPASAPRPVPTMIDIGVARPSAHGQAMISTATALTSA